MRRPYMVRVVPSTGTGLSRRRGPVAPVCMDRVVPSAKIPPSRRKINDTVLQRMTCPPEAAQDRPGDRGAQPRNYPAEVDRASLA